MKITLTQQSVNLLRQILSTPGLAKTTGDIYLDGELICIVIPEVDLDWMLTPEEQAFLVGDERKKYREKDLAWAVKEIEFDLTDKQYERIRDRLTKVLELIKIPQSKYLFRLYKDFKFDPTEK